MWKAEHPEAYAGQVIGNGHCVAFVRQASFAPHTSEWRRGPLVRTWARTDDAKGTAIATFDVNGRYGNHTDGRSHAAILVAVLPEGLQVWDQWTGRPVNQRVIRFRGGQGQAVDDGDAYHVIIAPPASEFA